MEAQPSTLSPVVYAALLQRGDPRFKAVWNFALSWMLMFVYVIFPSTSGKVFQTFSCRRFDDGRALLKADYRWGILASVRQSTSEVLDCVIACISLRIGPVIFLL
jgi:hypothetical protein